MQWLSTALGLVLAVGQVTAGAGQSPSAQSAVEGQGQPRTVLRTTVRRVVLDVVVTGKDGKPARGLGKDDFAVLENGVPQRILSFDANGFTPEMDYVPPKLPLQPPNTFMNLPSTPEKGPLYVLLYDLVDMDDPSQMDSPEDHRQQMLARQQMMKFVQSKPEGARFAVFVRSDGLHLVQGFTSDKAQLLATLDPHSPKPHIPMVFLMAPNFGRGNRLGALDTLHRIATYLDGLPGRKNLIWFSGMFPLSLFSEQNDGPNFQAETRATLDLLAHNQIAVYPVDARGVALEDSHAAIGTAVHSDTITSPIETPAATASAGGGAGAAGGAVQGDSAVVSSFNVMDGIARETGGRAFYGTNDVAAELTAATESGRTYYTLTYAPSDKDFNGKLRNLRVELAKKGYQLAYRRSYYGTELPGETGETAPTTTARVHRTAASQEPVVDTLSANMEHGAPTAHQLVFVVQAKTVGAPEEGTPEQMAQLATEPAYFRSRRRSAAPKPLAPVTLQKDVFSFEIPSRQFKGEMVLDLELAVAAYDADGQMMNGIVRLTNKEIERKPGETEPPPFYRVDQELEVPVGAASIRFAVRDTKNDRTGAMEVPLPLSAVSAP